MCYFLYGCINEKANSEDVAKIQNGIFRFEKGSRAELEAGINTCGNRFRLTGRTCDCGTGIGKNDADLPDIKELAAYIGQLKAVKNIQYICIAKNWWQEPVEKTESVHIDDIESIPFLAGLGERCLYTVRFYNRSWRN